MLNALLTLLVLASLAAVLAAWPVVRVEMPFSSLAGAGCGAVVYFLVLPDNIFFIHAIGYGKGFAVITDQ
mgnify:CR=1 FL=1